MHPAEGPCGSCAACGDITLCWSRRRRAADGSTPLHRSSGTEGACRISVAAIERALDHFAAHLDSTGLIDDMASWETRQELVHLKDVDTLEDELREEA